MKKTRQKKLISEFTDKYAQRLAHTFDTYRDVKNTYSTDKKMNFELISEHEHIVHKCKIKRLLLPLASAILTIILALSCWKPITEFAVNTFEKYTAIHYLNNFNSDFELNNISIMYIPNGYLLIKSSIKENTLFNVYANKKADDFITVEINKSSAINENIDTEDARFTEYELYGFPAYRSVKGGRLILLVFVGNASITVTGNISVKEAEEIISGVRIN